MSRSKKTMYSAGIQKTLVLRPPFTKNFTSDSGTAYSHDYGAESMEHNRLISSLLYTLKIFCLPLGLLANVHQRWKMICLILGKISGNIGHLLSECSISVYDTRPQTCTCFYTIVCQILTSLIKRFYLHIWNYQTGASSK